MEDVAASKGNHVHRIVFSTHLLSVDILNIEKEEIGECLFTILKLSVGKM